MTRCSVRSGFNPPSRAQGVTTLAITLILLAIVTVMVLLSSNVAFFEQRTTTSENRGRLAEQAAEYAVNLAGEFLKANRERLISDAPGTGWLDPSTGTGSGRRWVSCASVSPMPATHVCMAERNATRRAQLYFYSATGAAGGAGLWPAVAGFMPSANNPNLDAGTGVGGAFATSTGVDALLCRIDTSCAESNTCGVSPPSCQLEPISGNRIAITLVANATLPGESAAATVKETWATVQNPLPMAAVPVVASGFIQGLGNAQVVAAPNGAGFGVPVSMWSPKNVCIDGAGGCTGVGSVATCQLDEYLKSTPPSQLKTTCATTNNACGCPAISAVGTDFLSGHSGATKREGLDILDVDGNSGASPDILFYPGDGLDELADRADDSLFEWIFGVEYEAAGKFEGVTNGHTLQNCSGPTNCAVYALEVDFGAPSITCAQINSAQYVNEAIVYVPAPGCKLPAQIGTPDSPRIVVLNETAELNSTIVYGMLFVRSDTNSAELKGVGNSKIFGAIVVQGNVNLAGSIDIVYDNTAVDANSPTRLPPNARFARVPGSWLDSRVGF